MTIYSLNQEPSQEGLGTHPKNFEPLREHGSNCLSWVPKPSLLRPWRKPFEAPYVS